MARSAEMMVRFWGVRGSIACPGPQTVRYGGNTSCVEVRCDEQLVIFDAGTGLRSLGDELAAAGTTVEAHVFCTHFHFDHICGLPFFAPLYTAGNRICIWAGHLGPELSVGHVLHTALTAPYCPDLMHAFTANLEFRNFERGQTLVAGPGTLMRTAALHHPGGATGYRLEYGGKAIAYITDTEHRPDEIDPNVLSLAERADIMIYDAHYTQCEYPTHVGWGHSTWQEGVRLADAAGAKLLVLFHHAPEHDDAAMDRIAAEAAQARPGTVVAREGLVLRV